MSATSAEEETETLSALVSLSGSTVAESKSKNQTRIGRGDIEDCFWSDDIYFKKRMKVVSAFLTIGLQNLWCSIYTTTLF
jgi:hypothetical protein